MLAALLVLARRLEIIGAMVRSLYLLFAEAKLCIHVGFSLLERQSLRQLPNYVEKCEGTYVSHSVRMMWLSSHFLGFGPNIEDFIALWRGLMFALVPARLELEVIHRDGRLERLGI